MRKIYIPLLLSLILISCSSKVRVVVKDIGKNGCDNLEEKHIEHKRRTVRTLYCKKEGFQTVEWSIARKIGSGTLEELLNYVQGQIKNNILKGKETISGVSVMWKAKDEFNYKIKIKE
jgi:hypothetical protein